MTAGERRAEFRRVVERYAALGLEAIYGETKNRVWVRGEQPRTLREAWFDLGYREEAARLAASGEEPFARLNLPDE